MQIIRRFMLPLMALVMLAVPVLAESTTTADGRAMDLIEQMTVPNAVKQSDQALDPKQKDFKQFAESLVLKLNRTHNKSRARMQITRLADGTYRGQFHQIDDNSLQCNVRRSQSKTIPYVGVLSYQEKVFEAVGKSPEELKQADFRVVSIIPNKHIFSYKNGSWD